MLGFDVLLTNVEQTDRKCLFIIGCGDVGTGNETRVAERMALVHFFYENGLWKWSKMDLRKSLTEMLESAQK